MARCVVLATLAAVGVGCGGDPPAFPLDYAATYQEVRNCRLSLEHNLVYIRVLAAPDALAAYTVRSEPFPDGAILVKEQYGDADLACAGPIEAFTVMTKQAVGSSPATLDWTWTRAGPDQVAVTTDVGSCTRCHAKCGVPPDGYDGTCTVP